MKGKYEFEVYIDESLKKTPCNLDEELLLKLDSYRENSLQGYYSISQKGRYSIISQNV